MSKKVEIKISGMSCNHCTGSVEKSLNSVEGVSAKVTLEDETAHISLSSDVSDEKLRKTIEDAGYDVVSINHI